MRHVLLPSTPLPPFRSSASSFKAGGIPPNRSWDQRRPSLPATLSTWGGSTPNLAAGNISNPISQRSLIDEVRIQTLVSDILALPTVPNTREILIEWIRRTRHRQLVEAKGWWVTMSGDLRGVDFVDDTLNLVESDCMDKHHFHLIPVFDHVRKAFLLPERSVQVLRRAEAIRQATSRVQEDRNRYRQGKPATEQGQGQEPVKATVLVIKRSTELTSGTALQLVTDTFPLAEADRSALAESVSGQPVEFCGTLDRPVPDRDDSEELDQPGTDQSEPSTAVHETFVAPNTGSEMKLSAAFPSPLEPSHHATRHRKGMSKMSVFSSETALEMASIFATRDSASRSSHRSLASSEPEPEPIPKLSPLPEESPRPLSDNDPLAIAYSPSQSRLRSIPLSDEVYSDGENNVRISFEGGDGDISPFPKVTSPPRPIPDRTTSLQQGVPTSRSKVADGPAAGSILKRTPQATPDPNRFLLTMPSTLSQVLNLFEPGTTRLAPGLSPGMLEIELLRIIEAERQKISLQGQTWSRQETSRAAWLLEEIRLTVSSAGQRYVDRRKLILFTPCS